MGLLNSVRDYFAMRKFMKTQLAQALREHTQEYFYRGSVLSGFSEEAKQSLISGMGQQMGAAFQSPDPVMAVREALVSYIISFAQLQALCLTEAEKADAFYAPNPHISGALHHDIAEAAKHVDEVARYQWEQGADADDLIAFCNTRCAVYLYFMNAFNMARMELGDKTDPDWFRPLVEAQLVYAENTIRSEMGAPLKVRDMVEALAYSVMNNMTLNGATNPFYEWCTSWPDKYLAGRGPDPRAAND